jgi:WD40 repeat protein
VLAWAVARLPAETRISINTVILSGSVLRAGFPWRDLIGKRIKRVINDCGTKDGVLLLSQFGSLFTGMAGRTGFGGATSNAFRNRYSVFGHSGYFKDTAFSPDGRRVVTASADKTARLWDAETGTTIAVLKGHGDVVRMATFSPDGQRVATA